jgi:hypothetical protein
MRDITNQFIIEGLNGGVLTLFFFVLVLCRCFANVGRTSHTGRGKSDQD